VDYLFPQSVPVSAECKDLIAKILVADPDKRITVPQVLYVYPVRCVGSLLDGEVDIASKPITDAEDLPCRSSDIHGILRVFQPASLR